MEIEDRFFSRNEERAERRAVYGTAERSTRAFRDGKPVIGFQVTRAKGYSDVAVVGDVRTAVATFAKAHSEVKIAEASNTVTPIQENYEGSMLLLVEGALLAILVVLFRNRASIAVDQLDTLKG